MRIPASAAVAATVVLAAQATAQTPAPPPINVPTPAPLLMPPPPPPLPEKWEDLPPRVQEHLGKRVADLKFQSVLVIAPSQAPAGPRMLDPGAMLVSQEVTPAHGVRLTSDAMQDKYGKQGDILWQARDAQGDAWCKRSKVSLWNGLGHYYCYRDRNGDGTFEEFYDKSYWGAETTFQTLSIGDRKEMKKPVSFVAAEAPPLKEIVGLRYKGVNAGLIAQDGMVKPGTAQVELVVGPQPGLLKVLATFDVELNAQGRGHLDLITGHEVTIEQVSVDGRAKIEVKGALEPGEGYLLPAVTRERLLESYRAALQRRFGARPPAPRPKPAPPAGDRT